jgi:superfamily II helicase
LQKPAKAKQNIDALAFNFSSCLQQEETEILGHRLSRCSKKHALERLEYQQYSKWLRHCYSLTKPGRIGCLFYYQDRVTVEMCVKPHLPFW